MNYDQEKHAQIYTNLHEGRRPDRFINEPVSRKPSRVRVLGRIYEIQYRKKVTDGEYSYWHPYVSHAQPKVGLDELGRIHIFAGRYVVTDRGIEDRNQSRIQSEFLPHKPRYLTDLGKLEFIRYKWYDQSGEHTGELRFSQHAPPILSHDENGNLHVLRGRVQSERKTGAKKVMAKSRSRSRRRRSHRRHSGFMRMNPSSRGGSSLQSSILGTIAVGGVGAGTFVGFDMLLRQFAPTLVGWQKAAVKIGGGIVGALLLKQIKAPTALALGVGSGAVADGVLDLWNMYGAPAMAPAPAPSARASLPAGYAPFNMQGCAVPQAAGMYR